MHRVTAARGSPAKLSSTTPSVLDVGQPARMDQLNTGRYERGGTVASRALTRPSRLLPVLVACAVGVALLVGTGNTPPALGAPTAPSWKNSGLDGGGFMSTIARSKKTGTIIAGGDTQGLFRSVDQGATWKIANTGIRQSALRRTASLSWVDNGTQRGLWFAAVGNAATGAVGGVLRSTDDGITWTLLPGSPLFEGGNTNLGAEHPRSTGNLMASDGVYLYAGAFASGLYRCKLSTNCDATAEWTLLGMAGLNIRSVGLDQTNNRLYAAVPGDGTTASVWVVSSPNVTSPETPKVLTGSPIGVEELVSIGGRVYAAGSDGVSRRTNTTWTKVSGGTWSAIDVRVKNGKDFLYLASGYLTPGRDVATLELTTDQSTLGTPTIYEDFDRTSAIRGTSRPWWLAQDAGSPPDLIGGDTYIGSQFMVDGVNNAVYLVGRAGIYRRDFTASTWQAAVNGLNTTFVQSVAVKPGSQSTVGVTDADWKYLQSQDGGLTVARDDAIGDPDFPGNGLGQTGLDLTWSGNSLIVSAGDQTGNSNGDVYINDAPGTASSQWRRLKGIDSRSLKDVAGGCRPSAITSNGAGTVFAAVAGQACAGGSGGLYVFSNNNWTRITDPTGVAPLQPVGIGAGADLSWAGGTDNNVYLWAPSTDTSAAGLWRYSWTSDPATGGSWLRIAPGTNNRGWIARHPTDPSTVWFATNAPSSTSTTGGLRKVTAATGPTPSVTLDGAAPAGPIATTGGQTPRLYLAVGATTAAAPQVYSRALSGSSFSSIGDSYYTSAGGFPTSIAASDDGTRVYVTLQGNGLIVRS